MSATNRGPRGGDGADFFPTPVWAVRRFLEVFAPRRGFWVEPGAGDGAIIRALEPVANHCEGWLAVELRASCVPGLVPLVGPGGTAEAADFLTWEPPPGARERVSLVIGNPPYSMAEAFVRRSFELFPDADVAMLLRLPFLASAGRADWLRTVTPDVYVLPNRPSFSANGKTDSTDYAWFSWEAGATDRPAHLHVLAVTPEEERGVRRRTKRVVEHSGAWEAEPA